MARVLLALIFAILLSPATVSGAERLAFADQAKKTSESFDHLSRHQGRDTLDVERQPCFNARSGGNQAANLEITVQHAIGDFAPSVLTLLGHSQAPVEAIFLYACAPRAPPVGRRI